MEQINQSAKVQLNPDSIINQITKIGQSGLQSLNLLQENPNGFNALDLIGDKISWSDIEKAEELIKINYGVDYPKEKLTVLWNMIKEENWTNERLQRTVKWFLKTKKFPNWTIADWFEYQIKLYPYGWYKEQISKGFTDSDMQGYKINGRTCWKFKDNDELPFEKIISGDLTTDKAAPGKPWNPKEDEHFQELKKNIETVSERI